MPLHDVALLRQCPHCHAPTASFGLQLDSFTKPFGCMHCGRAFAEPFDPSRWSLSAKGAGEIEQALGPLARWLRDLAGYLNRYDVAPVAQLDLRGTWSASNEIVCLEIARHLVPFPLPARYRCPCRRPLSYQLVRTRRVSGKPQGMEGVQLKPNVRHAIYRSIRRYLLRTCLKSHRECVRRARKAVGIRTLPGIREIVQSETGCLLAMAFARWESTYDEHARELRDEPTTAKFNWSDCEDADEVLWATQTLAEFTFSAATELELALADEDAPGEHTFVVGSKFAPYLALRHGGHACWSFKIDSDAEGRAAHLAVVGARAILQQLETHGQTTVEAHKVARRDRRFHFHPSHQGVRAEPRTARRVRLEKWDELWVSPYESALSVLLKYLRANPNRASEWEQLLFRTHREALYPLLSGRWMHKPQPAIAAGAALAAGTLVHYAPRWRCALSVEGFFRYCPQCLEMGYHSVFYQIRALRICPVHCTELQDRCRKCGALGPLYEPRRLRKNSVSYGCPECGAPVFESDSGQIPTEVRECLVRRLEPLPKWLTDCERVPRFDAPPLKAPIAGLTLASAYLGRNLL